MRKFEVGQRYEDNSIVFEITGRTENTIRFIQIQHFGKSNERKSEEKKAKIHKWESGEVFFTSYHEIHAR